MSVHTEIYVGPYIRLKLKKVANTETYITCLNDQCPGHKEYLTDGEKYCPKCGDPVHEANVGGHILLTYNDFISGTGDEYADELMSTQYVEEFEESGEDCLISNLRKDDMAENIEYGGNLDFNDVADVPGRIKKFEQEHEDLIAALKVIYHSENVTMCWGVVVYCR